MAALVADGRACELQWEVVALIEQLYSDERGREGVLGMQERRRAPAEGGSGAHGERRPPFSWARAVESSWSS